ncbi:MAG: fibronectin type III domain-containing protein [Bacteroidota bacterium]
MQGLKLRIRLFIFLLLGTSSSAYAIADRFRCTWRDDPATSMVIGWDQLSGNDPVLYYSEKNHGQKVSFYERSTRPGYRIKAKGMFNHFVRLTGLKPNTVYHFIVKDSEGMSMPLSFKTAPDTPERLAIIAGGDSRNHRDARRKANRLVAKLRPHFVMFAGDMTNNDTAPEWRNWFDDWQLTIGQDGRITPIVVARGNHEASNKSVSTIFDVKNPGIFYGFNFAGDLLRIYTLNSLIPPGGKQRSWLEADLAAHEQVQWKMAQYHHSIRPHTAKKPERNELMVNWAPLFYKHQVNLVVESDAHVVKSTHPIRPSREAGSEEGFIRDDERGTVYIGEGCWGAPLRTNNDDKSWTRASGSFNQFKWIFVDEYGIEVRTVKVDSEERVQDAATTNLFSVPAGLELWQPESGEVIYIRNDKTAPPPAVTAATPPKKTNARDWSQFPLLRPDAATGKVRLEYALAEACDLTILLIDSNWKEITRAKLPNQAKGPYAKKMDTSKIPAGKYLLVIKSGKNILKRYRIDK